MTKINILLMLLLISSAMFVAGCIDDDFSAEQIAEKMQQKQDSIEDYSYTMYMTMELGDQNMVWEADMMHKKPNKFKTVLKQPAKMAGSVTVFDGETMRTYDSQKNTVITMAMPDIEQNEMDYL
ncbi:MAG: outer membrane lipoprotein carrier protein LolA, partial [Desulfobacteraceae bacterium]|nr:outer membrane lipoprotein carrier protein LolA [Desulfobacteraceae bacterium]MBC2718187.1 outer membrane lipoprotein carrier protein LolA [Desulfobacteraceae bacterium]